MHGPSQIKAAERAYEAALAPAHDIRTKRKGRVPYPKAVKAALAAYDAVLNGEHR